MTFPVSKWSQSHTKSNSKCLRTFRDHLLARVITWSISQGLHDRDLNDRELGNYVHNYLRHGGKIWTTESIAFEKMFINYKVGHIDWIPDLLFSAPGLWLEDEFSSLQICLIGTLARVDALFRNRLKKEMASYRSLASSYRTASADRLFETTFGTVSIESRFRTLEHDRMYAFLSGLCRKGSVPMVKPFIDIGVDVNGGKRWNLLAEAAAAGNMDIVYMLLEAGANGTLAIRVFLLDSVHLSSAHFRRVLELLLENATPAPCHLEDDPLLAVIESSRAICSCPKAPKTLLDRKCYTKEGIGEGVNKISFHYSYMYQAIETRNASAVDLLLQNGARADALISHSFECFGPWFSSYTWLTLAVIRGDAACADVLIRHGADVTALDGAGRSAIHLARNHALGLHPRAYDWLESITVEEDAETLAVVERAFHLKFQGTKSIEDFLDHSDEIAPQSLLPQDEPVSMLQKTSEKVLRFFFTPTQTKLLLDHLRLVYCDIQHVWSLSFREALLMRCMYVSLYPIVLAYELQAFIRGHKRIPMPSRFILSALAFLALVLIWGSSS